jgi:hypothetical protein
MLWIASGVCSLKPAVNLVEFILKQQGMHLTGTFRSSEDREKVVCLLSLKKGV